MNDHDLRTIWEAEEAEPFTGWDFSHLDGRMLPQPLPWSYSGRAAELMHRCSRLLDLGTGGGEKLLELKEHWPRSVTVTEDYPPNVILAKQRLAPLGVKVRRVTLSRTRSMPFRSARFDLVVCRHAGFNCAEVGRILSRGGSFLTEQVSGLATEDLMAEFGATPQWPDALPAYYLPRLKDAGFAIVACEEWEGTLAFTDVGAIVYYLKNVPWLVPGFSVSKHFPTLLRLNQKLRTAGRLEFKDGMYLIEARKEGAAARRSGRERRVDAGGV